MADVVKEKDLGTTPAEISAGPRSGTSGPSDSQVEVGQTAGKMNEGGSEGQQQIQEKGMGNTNEDAQSPTMSPHSPDIQK